ncbi:MAG: anaerobic ribonucleoside triphosphate reductase [Desulfovibrio sp.]|nr:anaerobic ribonucleoside triphosphate reductase [Desulfovibrio sp.]
MPEKIIKRDGTEVDFDSGKILNAISRANAEADEEMTPADLVFVTEKVVRKLDKDGVNTVEGTQDVVEETLIQYDFARTAKTYILYRAEHAKIRNAESYLMDIYKTLTFSAAKDEDIKRENANIDGDTSMGTMLKYGSEGSKYYIDNFVLPKDISAAHLNGDIQIHDKDFYMLTETCCQIDLLKLFKDGFSTGHGFLREPQGIESYASLACVAIQANQNEMHGGQAVPHFDFCMAPGVAKTFAKEYRDAFTEALRLRKNLSREDATVEAMCFFEGLGIKPALGNLDAMKDAAEKTGDAEIVNAHAYAADVALERTDRRTYQAMEALVHNLNTMHSRAGAQVPFSSINYGTDTSPEGRMAVRNLLKATQAGLGNGETAIFPVQIFKVKEGVNYNPGDPNYDLFQLSMETSAKRLFPNFSFLDTPFNIEHYKPGDYNSEVAYMGCRTRVYVNNYDKTRHVTCGRGNLSFTTINLPRIGIEAHGDKARFFSILDDKIDLVFRQLLHRLKIQSARKGRNYPFLMGNGIWLDSEKLGPDDKIGEVLKHGTLTVGFIGLAEALKALMGMHHGESEEAQKVGLEIIGHMRKRCDDASAEHGLNFSLIGTPAEGLAGRFVPYDRARYGVIEGITDREYYTNSFHVPVYFPIKAFEKIQIEAPYHAFTNGGHITYVELNGDTCKNLKAFETIIRCMHDSGVGYGSINHPLDRDPVCGYTGVINDVCPRCGRREGEGVSIEKLKDLRRKYPNMPRWD